MLLADIVKVVNYNNIIIIYNYNHNIIFYIQAYQAYQSMQNVLTHYLNALLTIHRRTFLICIFNIYLVVCILYYLWGIKQQKNKKINLTLIPMLVIYNYILLLQTNIPLFMCSLTVIKTLAITLFSSNWFFLLKL